MYQNKYRSDRQDRWQTPKIKKCILVTLQMRCPLALGIADGPGGCDDKSVGEDQLCLYGAFVAIAVLSYSVKMVASLPSSMSLQ